MKFDLSNNGLYSKVYIPVITNRSRYLLMYGGRDSAKSYTAAEKIVHDILAEKYYRLVCLRKIFADIKDSQFETIWSVIESFSLERFFKFTKSPLEITCLLNGNDILARGLDRPAKLKSIKDPTCIWGEEVDELKVEDFIKSDTSIRSSYNDVLLQFIMTFNPENEDGWINRIFFPSKASYERPDGKFHFVPSIKENTTILHTTWRDNEFCPEERGSKYENLKHIVDIDENWYKVYCLGLWGNALKGLVFPNVVYRDKFPDIENCKMFGYSLDFGFTNDPTAIVKCALAHGELWFQELTYKSGLVNTGNKNSITFEFKEHNISQNDDIVADSAEPKSIEEIKRAGWNKIHGVKKTKGSIESSITFMKQYTINIIGANLKKECRSYKYKTDKTTNLSTNEPIDQWNHAIDACRYWVIDKLMTQKNKIKAYVV